VQPVTGFSQAGRYFLRKQTHSVAARGSVGRQMLACQIDLHNASTQRSSMSLRRDRRALPADSIHNGSSRILAERVPHETGPVNRGL